MLSSDQKLKLEELRRQLSQEEKKVMVNMLLKEREKRGWNLFCCNCHSTCADDCEKCFDHASFKANVKVSAV
jgi:hypothetical protein